MPSQSFIRVFNMTPVLNMPGLRIWQGIHNLAWVTKGEYA